MIVIKQQPTLDELIETANNLGCLLVIKGPWHRYWNGFKQSPWSARFWSKVGYLGMVRAKTLDELKDKIVKKLKEIKDKS